MKRHNLNIIVLIVLALGLSACESSNTTEEEPVASSSGTLPDIVKGNIIVMTYDFEVTGQSGPVNLNDNVGFTFSSSGALFINTDNTGPDEITINSFTELNGEFTWEDVAGGFKYTLSLKSDGSINEINVRNSADVFVGQFGIVVSNSGSTGSGGGSNSGTNGVSFIIEGNTYSSTTFTSQKIRYGTPDIIELTSSAGLIYIPRKLGTFDCNILITGAYVQSSSSTKCTGDVTSISPLIATFSGDVSAISSLSNVALSNGSIYLDTQFVASNSSTIDATVPFTISYGGVALNAATCDPSVLVTPTASTLLGGFNSDVYGWTGDVNEPAAFFEFSLNKAGSTSTPGQVNFRFVCANLNISWQVSGTLADLGISLDTSLKLVNFNNTVVPYALSTGAVTNGFPTDTTIIPSSSLSITLNGSISEL